MRQKLLIFILFLYTFCCIHATPKVFNLRGSSNEADDRDQFSLFTRSEIVKEYGSSNSTDYFRLLEFDGDYLIIGAADSVHNISVENFTNVSIYRWPPGELEREDCACRNYIRVLSRRENGDLLVCGTNAYKPMCRLLESQDGIGTLHNSAPKILNEFSGAGLSPLDPRHNTTFYMDNQMLYAATGWTIIIVFFIFLVADFSGTDSLIFRRNISMAQDRGLRTQRNNAMLLNQPQFVGTLHSDEYVYFFFREEALEAGEFATYSRVARVCKKDNGGPRNYYETEWTSFAKARLNCSVPEKNKPFYFDEIISISNLILKKKTGRAIVYASFVSEFNFLRHSVICAFDLAQIDALFEQSDLMAMDSERRKWLRQTRTEKTKQIGMCRPNTKQMNEDEAITMRSFPLMADSVPNYFSAGAVGIYRGSDHYNQIVVLENVEFHEGVADVLYVATDQGNIIKMVNLIDFYNKGNKRAKRQLDIAEQDPLVQVALYELPIRRLLISKDKYLIAVTDPIVYRLPLHICSAHSDCEECIGSRDPHCVWHDNRCQNVKNVQKKYAFQDVLQRRAKLCATMAAAVAKETFSRRDSALETETIASSKNISNFDSNCKCHKNGIDSAKNCSCINETINGSNSNVDPNTEESFMAFGKRIFGFSDLQTSAPEATKNLVNESLPWWVLLIIALAVLQSIGFVYLCFRMYSRRKKTKGAKSLMPKTSKLINPHVLGYNQSMEPISAYAASTAIRPSQRKVDTFNSNSLKWPQKTIGSATSSWQPNSSTTTLPSLNSLNNGSYGCSTMSRPTTFSQPPMIVRRLSQGEVNIQLDGSLAPGPIGVLR